MIHNKVNQLFYLTIQEEYLTFVKINLEQSWLFLLFSKQFTIIFGKVTIHWSSFKHNRMQPAVDTHIDNIDLAHPCLDLGYIGFSFMFN